MTKCNGCANYPRVSDALDALSRHGQRATYGSLSERAGGPIPQAVMGPHDMDPRHAWIVRRDTGLPTGYPASAIPKNLEANPSVLSTPEALEKFLANHRAK